MANMIGTTRQSVTSALNALRRRGVLDFDESHRLYIHSERLLDKTVLSGLAAPQRHIA
jgi:DNA-binding FadR family transcriptional regulator